MNEKELTTQAEVILMEIARPVTNMDDLKFILTYIAKVFENCGKTTFDAEQVIQDAFKYASSYEIQYVNLTGQFLNIIYTTEDDEGEFNILDTNGVFGYVYNITDPYCSELGYAYYRRVGGSGVVKRVA